jgi:putative transposase
LASAWPWNNLAKRAGKSAPPWLLWMNQSPVDPPADWMACVNRAETAAELQSLHVCVERRRPYGDERWERRTAKRLELESTLRPRGRQRIHPIKDSRPL